jgi:hypothetical protein
MAICQICGKKEETRYHAVVVRCPKVVGLRHALRKVWNLPEEEQFRFSGPFMHMLYSVDDESRDRIMLLFWRAWHLRNDVLHGKGNATIGESVL